MIAQIGGDTLLIIEAVASVEVCDVALTKEFCIWLREQEYEYDFVTEYLGNPNKELVLNVTLTMRDGDTIRIAAPEDIQVMTDDGKLIDSYSV